VTNQLLPLYNPRTQSWIDHFHWANQYEYIVGQWPRRPGPTHADRRASSGVCEARTALGYAQPLTPLSVPYSTQRLPICLYRPLASDRLLPFAQCACCGRNCPET
jgi:hypothetical protein